MKILKYKYFLAFIVSIAIITGCKDDPPEEVSSFVGNFVISHAEVATTTLLMTVEGPQIPVPAGTDITTAIQNALLSSVDCSSADKSYVELREDNSIYMSCEGQNEINAGTWEEVSATELKLNLNHTAIPGSPTGMVLSVTEIVKNATGWTGKTSVPMPKEMFAPILLGFGFTIADTPATYLITFSLDFIEK